MLYRVTVADKLTPFATDVRARGPEEAKGFVLACLPNPLYRRVAKGQAQVEACRVTSLVPA